MAMSAPEWLERYAAELGIPAPTAEETNDLLALAGVAAHASERTAAPVSCWLAARAGIPPGRAVELARQLAERLTEQPTQRLTEHPEGPGAQRQEEPGHPEASRSAPE